MRRQSSHQHLAADRAAGAAAERAERLGDLLLADAEDGAVVDVQLDEVVEAERVGGVARRLLRDPRLVHHLVQLFLGRVVAEGAEEGAKLGDRHAAADLARRRGVLALRAQLGVVEVVDNLLVHRAVGAALDERGERRDAVAARRDRRLERGGVDLPQMDRLVGAARGDHVGAVEGDGELRDLMYI